MNRTRVKICGTMRPVDAQMAVSLGADAIGMIFHPPSKRAIPLGTAREIVRSIGPFVTPVGVFVDAETETIATIARTVGLRVVQLHGNEPPQQVAALGGMGLKVIKAFRVDARLEGELKFWKANRALYGDALVGLVMETAATPLAGGSGVPNDFVAIAHHQTLGHFNGLPPMIVAGGLAPENVAEVVRTIRPWAVDVSSGVEAELGVKSSEKVAAFIGAVWGADTAITGKIV